MKETERAVPVNRLAMLLFAVGAGLVAFAILADPLTGGSPGFGVRQWALAAVGGALLLEGARRTPAAWARLRAAVAVSETDVVLSPVEIGLLALAIAALTAVVEGLVLAASAVFFGEMHRLGFHAVWMAALTNALVLAAIAALLLLVGRLWRKARSATVVVFIFALLAADTIVHRFPEPGRAQAWSKWLLAAGFGVIVARGVTRWLRGGRRHLRPAVAAALALVVALAGSAFARTPVVERLARAGLPAAAPGAPNILVIILDTVRAASLGLHGYERPTTPNLDRLATSSVVFDQAIAPSSWTLPSHATLFTGRYPNELSADWRVPLDDTHATLAEVLSARGYATAGFSANGAYANANTGLERGFARFEDFPATPSEALRTSVMLRRMVQRLNRGDLMRDGYTGRKSAAAIGGAFLGWLADKPADRPFFAFLNYFDAHDPYMPAAPFDTMFGPVRPPPRLNWGKVPSEELVAAWTDDYDRAIAYIDHELGRLFDELARRGALDETIVVVTADHGEHLGEHGYMRHGNTLYLPVLHVPLIVRFPAATPRGVRVAAPVTLRDVPATLLDLAGFDGTSIPGTSLANTWRGGGAPDSPLYAEVRQAVRIPARYPNADADVQSLFARGLHYIRDTEGGEELYRFLEDRGEERDLGASADAAPEMTWMRKALERHLLEGAPAGIDPDSAERH